MQIIPIEPVGEVSFAGRFAKAYPASVRLARGILLDRGDAEEIAQAAWATAHRRWTSIDDPVLHVRRRVVRDGLRALRRHRSAQHPTPRSTDEPPVSIQRALASLSPRTRAAVVLHDDAELSDEEIAPILRNRVATVAATLRGAERDLRSATGLTEPERRRSLIRWLDDPPAAPPPIERIEARAASEHRRQRRRLVAGSVAALVIAGGVVSITRPDREQALPPAVDEPTIGSTIRPLSDPDAGWVAVPAGETHPVTARFLSADLGWVLGVVPGCDAPVSLCRLRLLRTRDGGTSWQTPYEPRRFSFDATALPTIDFADDLHGLIRGRAREENGPDVLYSTRDGGATWRQTDPLVGYPSPLAVAAGAGRYHLVKPDPSDAARVQIVTSPVDELRWTPATSIDLPGGGRPAAQLAFSGERGWLVATGAAGSTGARFDGAAWTPWTPPCADAGVVALAPSSVDDLAVLCSGGAQLPTTFVSSDGGESFQRIEPSRPPPGGPAVALTGSESGLVSPSASVLLTWSEDITNAPPDQSGLRILRSTDSGGSWQQVYAAPYNPFEAFLPSSFDVLRDGSVVAYARSQTRMTVRRSFDLGESWAALGEAPTDSGAVSGSVVAAPTDPVATSFVSPDVGWITIPVAGCDEREGVCPVRVVRTTDGGVTWLDAGADLEPALEPTAAITLSFADARHGLLAGSLWPSGEQLVTTTSDGGRTWQPLRLGGDEVEILAAGAHGGRYHLALSRGDGRVELSTSPPFDRPDEGWTEAPVELPIGRGSLPRVELVFVGDTGWAMVVNRTVVSGARYRDGAWEVWTPPCVDAAVSATLAASSSGDLAALCKEGEWSDDHVARAVHTSDDGGDTFTRRGSACPTYSSTPATCLAPADGPVVAPSPRVLVVGTPSGLVRSTEAGALWIVTRSIPPIDGEGDLAWSFQRVSDDVLIALVERGGRRTLLRSTDRGESWEQVVGPGPAKIAG